MVTQDEILKRINCDVSTTANFSGEEVWDIINEIREDLELFFKNNTDSNDTSFQCHSCKTHHTGKNDDQVFEVCKNCYLDI